MKKLNKSTRSAFLVFIVMILLCAPLLLSEESSLYGTINSVTPGSSTNLANNVLANTSSINGHLSVSGQFHPKISEIGNIPVLSSNKTLQPLSSNANGKKAYEVTFTESGLPSGSTWNLGIENYTYNPEANALPQEDLSYLGALLNISAFSSVHSTSGTSISIYLTNGTYLYSAGYSGTHIGSHLMPVDGMSQNIKITFPELYKVTINVQNLPSGISWNVLEISLSPLTYYVKNSYSTSITSYMPNGTYEFDAGPRFTYMEQKAITVEGKSISLTIKFPALYKVKFTEANLHHGNTWYTYAINGNSTVIYVNSTHGNTMVAFLPTNTYTYYSGYNPFQNETGAISISSIMSSIFISDLQNPNDGISFTINSNSEDITVQLPVAYTVKFSESNVPSGVSWGICISNSNISASDYSFTHSIVAYLPHGSIYYNGYYSSVTNISLPESSLTFESNSINVSLAFPAVYKVIFTEKNVPAGVTWSLSLNGYDRDVNYFNSSSSSSMIAYLPVKLQNNTPNITYRYSAKLSGITYLSGSFEMNSTTNEILLQFPATYRVEFTEENVLSGITWSLRLNNTGHNIFYSNSTTSSSMVAYLPAGTFTYQGDYFSSGLHLNLPYKKFVVGMTSLSVSVVFPLTYKVTFTEENVPSGVTWTMGVNNKNDTVSYSNSTSGSSMIAYLPLGIYNYSGFYHDFMDISTSVTEFTLSSTHPDIAVVFPVTYKVTFTEENVPSGVTWTIILIHNNQYSFSSNSTSSSSMVAYLTDGKYNYSGYYYHYSLNSTTRIPLSKEQFSVENSALSLSTVFPETYKVTFTEKNVPSGMIWSLSADNKNDSIFYSNSTPSSSMVAYLPYNTYNFSGSYNNPEVISVSTTEFSVNSRSTNISVVFPKTYKITFTEKNVPAGFIWTLNINNNDNSISYYNSSSSSSMIAYLPNGTYNYSGRDGYYHNSNNYSYLSISQKEFSVDKSSATISVDFPVTYKVTLTEKNLQAGIKWKIALSGNKFDLSYSNITSSRMMTLNLPNGTYNYTGSYSSIIAQGHFTSKEMKVYGKSININVTFQRAFLVTFKESGLSSGLIWAVSLNGTTKSSTGSTIIFTANNGTFSYDITSVNGYSVSPSSGNIVVNDGNYSQSVAFKAKEVVVSKYTVTFTETGLPSGSTWYVNLSSGMKSGPLTGSSYSFQLVNSSYTYSIATNDKIYHAEGGSFTVNGDALSEKAAFSRVTYTVTFSETGLPSGTSWSVTFNGTMQSSSTDTITFTVVNGTYSFSAGNVTGFKTTPAPGTVDIHGANVSQSITYTSTTTTPARTPSTGLTGMEVYGIVGAIVALIVIGAAVVVVRRRK